MNFENLEIWKKEAILITEILCGFYGVRPISKYPTTLEIKITKLVSSVGSLEKIKSEIGILKRILPEIARIQSPILATRTQFIREGKALLQGNLNFLETMTKTGRKTLVGNFEYWFFAMIQESNRNAQLTEALLAFIESDGEFQSWFDWRYGSVQMPFHFPKINRRTLHRKGDFKSRIKESTENTINTTASRQIAKTYRNILFRRNMVDEVELGAYSYLYALDNL